MYKIRATYLKFGDMVHNFEKSGKMEKVQMLSQKSVQKSKYEIHIKFLFVVYTRVVY